MSELLTSELSFGVRREDTRATENRVLGRPRDVWRKDDVVRIEERVTIREWFSRQTSSATLRDIAVPESVDGCIFVNQATASRIDEERRRLQCYEFLATDESGGFVGEPNVQRHRRQR